MSYAADPTCTEEEEEEDKRNNAALTAGLKENFWD